VLNRGGPTISWLEVLKNETDIDTDAASSSSDATELSESLTQQGAKSARSPTSTPDGEETCGVNSAHVKPIEVRRTLVTAQEHLSGVVADLGHADVVALDLETTVLNPYFYFYELR
jgi:hypothetical protein